jgi:hypothetical protein
MKIENFTSLPAMFISVSPNSESPLFTRAKLKVFYIGETVDHRLFTQQFAEKLMRTLPYTPVVGYYKTDKDDFEGHAENQYVYGVVDPMVEPKFEADAKGTRWAICDVILYTERPDQTGAIAQKIVGHPESLEMNPKTVQYRVNRDGTGRFKNIEFTSGEFIGVSVLGKDEKPAFPNAQFFSLEKFATIKESCTNRGTKMTITIPSFMEQSWSETQRAVAKALDEKFVNGCYLIDMYDGYCVAYIAVDEHSSYLAKIPYTCTIEDKDYKVTLGEPTKVHVKYEEMAAQTAATEGTVTQVPASNVVTATATTDPATQMACGGGAEADKKKKKDEGACETNTESDADAKKKKDGACESTTDDADAKKKKEGGCGSCESTTQDADAKKKKEAGACEAQSQVATTVDVQNTTSEASLSDDERKELDSYRKQDKIELINSFKDSLGEETIKSFIEKVDTYSKTDLTNALNAEFVKIARSGSIKFSAGLSWIPDNENSNDEPKTADEKLAESIRVRKNRGNK